MRYLAVCDQEFPNLEDTRHKLAVALIFNYKRSTHAKEKESGQTKNKNRKEIRVKENSRARFRAASEDKIVEINQETNFFILFLFSYFLFNHRDVFNG